MFDPAINFAEPPAHLMRMPRDLDLELSARCNLRCTYCYYFDNEAVPYSDLTTDEWLQFFDELGDVGVMKLTLAGGEPFMRKDLKTLLQGMVDNRMRFCFLTNGALINDDIAAFIAGTGRCDYIQVSLDGSRPETHDICRGKGSFDRAVRGLKTAQRHGIHVVVRTTIHRHNVEDLDHTAKFLIEDLGLGGFSTNSAGYLGSCRHNSNSVQLTVEQRQLAMESLLRLNEQYNNRISATAGPLAEARAFRRMIEAQQAGAEPFGNGGCLSGCNCHTNKLSVRADGAYVVCSMLAHTVLGEVNKDSLLDVWQKNVELNKFRHRRSISLDQFAHCQGCPYQDYCTGNCPGTAYTLSGKAHHPSPDACLRNYLDQGGKVPDVDVAWNGDAVRSTIPVGALTIEPTTKVKP